MRMTILGLFLALAALSPGLLAAGEYRAGYAIVTTQVSVPFDVLVAYPTESQEERVAEGPFAISASRDSPIASDARFPIILFAHGNGRSAGTPIPHHGMLFELARRGFIVVAPFFPGGERPFDHRPRQVQEALEAALNLGRIEAHADQQRMGMIGYSFGAAVALMNAGAKVNFAHLGHYCSKDGQDDPRACSGIPTDGSLAGLPSRASESLLPLKALVLLEPFGAPFDRQDLEALDMPVMIVNALQSDLKAAGNAHALAAALPKPPRTLSIPGSHFVFIGPCPSQLGASEPLLCGDPPNVDRGDILQHLRGEVVMFLWSHL